MLEQFKPKRKYKILDKIEFGITINTRFADSLNNELSPLVIPTQLKNSRPISIFGLTDFLGYYSNSFNKIAKFNNNDLFSDWVLQQNGIVGDKLTYNTGNYPFSLEQYGNYILEFQSRPGGVPYDRLIQIQSNNILSYSSFLNKMVNDVYIINKLKIIVPNSNIDQFNNSLYFSKFNKNNIITDKLVLNTYLKPENYNLTIADIPLDVLLDKDLLINQYINYDCQQMQFIFSLFKIK